MGQGCHGNFQGHMHPCCTQMPYQLSPIKLQAPTWGTRKPMVDPVNLCNCWGGIHTSEDPSQVLSDLPPMELPWGCAGWIEGITGFSVVFCLVWTFVCQCYFVTFEGLIRNSCIPSILVCREIKGVAAAATVMETALCLNSQGAEPECQYFPPN